MDFGDREMRQERGAGEPREGWRDYMLPKGEVEKHPNYTQKCRNSSACFLASLGMLLI